MVDCPSHARNTRPVGAAHSSPSSQHSLGTAPLFSLSVAKMLPALHVAGCSARAHFHFFVSLGCPSLLLSARAHLIPSHSPSALRRTHLPPLPSPYHSPPASQLRIRRVPRCSTAHRLDIVGASRAASARIRQSTATAPSLPVIHSGPGRARASTASARCFRFELLSASTVTCIRCASGLGNFWRCCFC
jgi:hypothetical protein